MDPYSAIQIAVLVLLVLLSAFFSSAETALTTVNKIKMKTMADDGNKKAALVLKMTDDPGKMLSAILIGNNVVNLSASSLATMLATRFWGGIGPGIATGVLTFVVLVFGEISPKTAASIYATKLAMIYAPLIYGLMTVLTPVIFIINAIAGGFLRIFGINKKDADDVVTEDEIRTMVDESLEDGEIETEEQQMIHKVFDFSEARAKEVMVPRVDMTMVDVESTLDELFEIYRENMFTRLPVYEESQDNIIGIINMKDLVLRNPAEEFSVRNYLRDAFFTREQKKTADLFEMMKKDSIPMAIVLDEYGTVSGLVTLEDLIEEIVGEIRDEYDSDEEDLLTAISDREYIVRGGMNLEDACDALGLDYSSEDYDSIGGYLTGLLDHFPEEHEIYLTDDDVYFRVEEVDKKRIEKIYIRLPESHQQDEETEE